MSEQHPNQEPQTILKKAGRTALGLTLAASAGFVGGKVAGNTEVAAPGMTKQAVERVISEARTEQELANFEADRITRGLQNADTQMVPAAILNGDITVTDKATGTHANTYHDVVVLFGAEDPALHHDATGKHMENKWFGMTEVRPDGTLAIHPFQYDSERGMAMHFDDPNNTIRAVQLYTQPSKGTDPLQLYAFDPVKEQTVFNEVTNRAQPIGSADGMK